MKKVCVIGLGCIGLPTACILSSKGFKVVGVDTDQKLVEELHQVNIDPLEPGLANLANSVIKSGNFAPKISPEEADVFMICVPTPSTDENKADLTYVKDAAKSVLPHLRKGNLVILESTVPPGTTEETLKPIAKRHLPYPANGVSNISMVLYLLDFVMVTCSGKPIIFFRNPSGGAGRSWKNIRCNS